MKEEGSGNSGGDTGRLSWNVGSERGIEMRNEMSILMGSSMVGSKMDWL